MNKVLTLIVIICILFSLGCNETANRRGQKICPTSIAVMENNANTKKAVLAAHDEITRSAEQLDVDKFFSYIAENNDGSIVQDGTLFLTRTEALNSTRTAFDQITKLNYEFDNRHVKVISPSTAILVSKGTATSTIIDGRSFTTPFVNSSVFVLQDNQWKILHGHHSIPNTN